MDKYATLYSLAPEGEWDVSFEWDDSIIVDSEVQMGQLLSLVNAELMSKTEFGQWYFGDSEAQAKAALDVVAGEKEQDFDDAFKLRDS